MPSTRISLPHSQSARGIIEQRGRAVFSPTDLVGEMEPDTFVQGVKLHARLYCTMREQGPGSAHTPPVSSLLSQDTTCSASDHVLCRVVTTCGSAPTAASSRSCAPPAPRSLSASTGPNATSSLPRCGAEAWRYGPFWGQVHRRPRGSLGRFGGGESTEGRPCAAGPCKTACPRVMSPRGCSDSLGGQGRRSPTGTQVALVSFAAPRPQGPGEWSLQAHGSA